MNQLEMSSRNQSLRQALGASQEERLRRRVPRLHQRHRHHVQGEWRALHQEPCQELILLSRVELFLLSSQN